MYKGLFGNTLVSNQRIARMLLATMTLLVAVIVSSSPASAQAANGGKIFFNGNKYFLGDGSKQGSATLVDGYTYLSNVSPDGTKIASYSKVTNPGVISVVNRDGSNRQTIQTKNTVGSVYGFGRHLSWSPDSTRIAYWNDTNKQIVVANVSGDTPTVYNVKGNPARDSELTPRAIGSVEWLNNDELLYLPYNTLGNDKFCRINAVTGTGKSCTKLPLRAANDQENFPLSAPNYLSMTLSPDKTKLLFSVNRGFTSDPTYYSADLWTSSLSGSRWKAVVLSERIFESDRNDNHKYTSVTDAVWSPDSSKIAYVLRSSSEQGDPGYENRSGLFTVNASDSGTFKKLTGSAYDLNYWLDE